MASITVTPASGSITHLVDAVHVVCADVPNNDATAYSTAIYPTEPQISYYFAFSLTGQDTLKSPVFSTNPDGAAEWESVIIPAAGSWTVGVYDASDDSTIVTDSVTVA